MGKAENDALLLSQADETAHLWELHNILEHRRRLYEKQRSLLEPAVPPAIVLGLESTIRELAMVETRLSMPPSTLEVAQAVGTTGQYAALDFRVRFLEKQLREGLDRMGELLMGAQSDSADWRDQQGTARMRGQRRTLFAHIAIAVALIVLAGGVIYIVAALQARGF